MPDLHELSFQFIETRTCFGTHRQNRRALQKRSGHQRTRLFLHERQHLFFDQIFFGDDDETVAHSKQTADIEVFACLRHHAFISRDNEREQIDAMSTGEHVFDEAFVTGNVNET